MKRTFNHTAAHYSKDTSGNVALLFAISTFFIVGLLAMAVDLSNSYSAKQRLQDTSDAIALLAAKDKSLDTPAKLEVAAQALYDATYPGQKGIRIVIEDIRRDGDAVTIVSKNNVDTYFGGVFNKSDLDVGVTSTAVFSKASLDVALVLDTTGSMGQSVNGRRGGPSKMKGLKTAANGLINTFDNLDNTDLRLSVVPFAQYINVGKINSKAGWLDFANADQQSWKGCVGSRLNGNDESPTERGGAIPALPGQYCANEILPLTSNMASARRSINGLKPRGWTYIPSGITWGWRTLEGELPKKVAEAPAKDDHKRVMVIMTDGENTRSKSGLTHEGENLNNANRKTARLCESVKNDDIEIYTIAYALDDKFTKNLMRKCASSTANFFDAGTAADLEKAFEEIGRNLEVLRVSA